MIIDFPEYPVALPEVSASPSHFLASRGSIRHRKLPSISDDRLHTVVASLLDEVGTALQWGCTRPDHRMHPRQTERMGCAWTLFVDDDIGRRVIMVPGSSLWGGGTAAIAGPGTWRLCRRREARCEGTRLFRPPIPPRAERGGRVSARGALAREVEVWGRSCPGLQGRVRGVTRGLYAALDHRGEYRPAVAAGVLRVCGFCGPKWHPPGGGATPYPVRRLRTIRLRGPELALWD